MHDEFDGQVAVVTGGGNGIGYSIARLLLERGARVAILDIDTERLEKRRRQHGANALLACETDVTDESALAAARARVLDQFGRVDILVNNTGIYPAVSVSEMTVAQWDHVFDVNAKSMFLTTRTFMGPMVEQGYGRIVSIVTVDAYKAKPTMAHYAASKASVASLVKTFAHELAPQGVLVNGVSPGAVATERAKSQPWLKERIKEIPVGHAAEPEDIAEVVLFLASRRNRFVVGETVIASGGAMML